MALLGGLLGIAGAFMQELQSFFGGGLLMVFIGAPVIEEALKPAGIYLLLLRWPRALSGRVHTAALTALSGLCFGLIESFVYVRFYFPDQGDDFVLFRFTVPVAMHAFASFIVGLGLSRSLVDWAAGRQKLPKPARNYYLAGVGLHAAYNTAAAILSFAGVIDFE
ncbi:MAG: PrsW family intramembrane metalloprotease [Dehalococcoidia bacterium]|nr:PrsW family intramembrane metalloprotease [Dehalococcoidia bacterium]